MMQSARTAWTQPSAGFRNRYLLIGAFFVSTIGDWLSRLALPLLILQMTGSALSTAVTYALEYAPYIVFSLFGGVIADRVDRRRLLVASDACSAGIVGILAALVVFNVQYVALIYLGAFVLGSVRPFHHPAFQSIVPSIVPDEQLPKTNSQVQSIDSLLALAGPVIGGGVIAVLGVTTAFWLDAVSFVISALSISLISVAVGTRSNTRVLKMLTDLQEGISYILRDRVILWASVLMAGSNLGLCLIEANLIYYVMRLRDLPVEAVGIVLGAQGAGCILGALLAPWLGRRAKPGHLIVGCMIGEGVLTSLLILPLGLVGLAFAWGAVGIFTMVIVVTWFTLRQRIVPQALLGRVVALTRMIAFAAIPLAAVCGGTLLSVSDSAVPLVTASVLVQIAVVAVACLTPLRCADVPARQRPSFHVLQAALTEAAGDSKQ